MPREQSSGLVYHRFELNTWKGKLGVTLALSVLAFAIDFPILSTYGVEGWMQTFTLFGVPFFYTYGTLPMFIFFGIAIFEMATGRVHGDEI